MKTRKNPGSFPMKEKHNACCEQLQRYFSGFCRYLNIKEKKKEKKRGRRRSRIVLSVRNEIRIRTYNKKKNLRKTTSISTIYLSTRPINVATR